MATFFALLYVVAFIVFIVFIIKSSKKKKRGEDNSIEKKIWIISLAVFVLSFFLMGVTSPSKPKEEPVSNIQVVKEPAQEMKVETHTSTSITEPTEETSAEIEVSIDVVGNWNNEKAAFDINTNLPNETKLILSLRSGDYNTEENFTAQTDVIVENGKAHTDGFSKKGVKLTGDYDLSVSMSSPKLQSDNVRKYIGQNGEFMKGKYVEKSDITGDNVVSALFAVSLGDTIIVTPEDDYSFTTFAEEDKQISDEEIEKIADDIDSASDETEKVRKQVQKYIDDNYSYTTIDKVNVNANLGTGADGDYVALVYLTWSQKNGGKLSQEMLDMYSSDMAARMYDDLPEIQELAVFWTVPYLNNGTAKLSFERKNNGMAYSDKLFDKNFN